MYIISSLSFADHRQLQSLCTSTIYVSLFLHKGNCRRRDIFYMWCFFPCTGIISNDTMWLLYFHLLQHQLKKSLNLMSTSKRWACLHMLSYSHMKRGGSWWSCEQAWGMEWGGFSVIIHYINKNIYKVKKWQSLYQIFLFSLLSQCNNTHVLVVELN